MGASNENNTEICKFPITDYNLLLLTRPAGEGSLLLLFLLLYGGGQLGLLEFSLGHS